MKLIAPEVEHKKTAALWRSLEALDDYRARFDSPPDTLTNPILLGSLVQPVQPLDLTPRRRDDKSPIDVTIGKLPVARRDVERLRRALRAQPKLQDPDLGPGAQRGIIHRGSFLDAIAWLEIHGNDADSLKKWMALIAAGGGRKKTAKRRRRPRRRRRLVPESPSS